MDRKLAQWRQIKGIKWKYRNRYKIMLLARGVMGNVNWFISTIGMGKTKKNIGLLYRREEELSTDDSKKAEML